MTSGYILEAAAAIPLLKTSAPDELELIYKTHNELFNLHVTSLVGLHNHVHDHDMCAIAK
jgi:hypothetical protein